MSKPDPSMPPQHAAPACRTTAIGMVNTLSAAHNAGRFAAELKKYTRPQLLVIDELGHLPVDKRGAELLFQVVSERYERGAVVLTTNKAFKHWPAIFNNDSGLTSQDCACPAFRSRMSRFQVPKLRLAQSRFRIPVPPGLLLRRTFEPLPEFPVSIRSHLEPSHLTYSAQYGNCQCANC